VLECLVGFTKNKEVCMFGIDLELLGKAGLVTILLAFVLKLLWTMFSSFIKRDGEQSALLTKEREELKVRLSQAEASISVNATKCAEEHNKLSEYIRNKLTKLLEDNASFNHEMVKAQTEYTAEMRDLKKIIGKIGKIGKVKKPRNKVANESVQ
jgi:hypothetical protein